MRTRILPPEEWSRLIGTEAELVWPLVDPLSAEIVVVEDGKEIVGTWMLMKVVHAECMWISPKHRGSFAVAKRLIRGMHDLARNWGVSSVLTSSLDSHVSDLITRLGGTPLPGTSFMLPALIRRNSEVTSCQQL
jgi:hypothetical protein